MTPVGMGFVFKCAVLQLQFIKAGGIWRPATESYGSSVDVEMRRSISRAASHGVNLRFFEREKELIGLAKWPNKMGR